MIVSIRVTFTCYIFAYGSSPLTGDSLFFTGVRVVKFLGGKASVLLLYVLGMSGIFGLTLSFFLFCISNIF